jgi:endonuclease YncB( thermonuclease family)
VTWAAANVPLRLSAPTPAVIWAVHDGDTLTALVPLDTKTVIGVPLWAELPLRLAGCNARELKDPGGVDARDHLAELLPVGTHVTVVVTGADKYSGRMDGRITLPDGSDLVTVLTADHWVAAWNGTGPKPVPPWPRPTS